jgi:hypothetical protein
MIIDCWEISFGNGSTVSRATCSGDESAFLGTFLELLLMKMNLGLRTPLEMFTVAFLALVLCVCGPSAARADIPLFTTQQDFTGWSGGGLVVAPQATPDLDGSSTNALGNTSNAGGVGTPGSLGVADANNATNFTYFLSQGEQGNAAFISALGTAGSVLVDYTRPSDGSYFQLGLVLNYDGHFDQTFGSETNNGDGTFTAQIPYLFVPGSVSTYLQLGLIFNSDANGAFAVDNIRIFSIVPEPTSLVMLGSCLVFIATRRQRG